MDPEKSVDSSSCLKSIIIHENSNDSTLDKGQTSDSVSNKVLIEEQEEGDKNKGKENEDKPQITHENDARTAGIESHVNEEEVMDTVTAISIQETGSVINEESDTTTHETSKAKENEFHVINLSGVEEEERVCRICHFGCNQSPVSWELIKIGCKCKNGLDLVHKQCAEVWFKLKGNNVCEICGDRAKNVRFRVVVRERREEREREERREMEVVRRESSSSSSSEERSGGGEISCFFFFILLLLLALNWLLKKINAMKIPPII